MPNKNLRAAFKPAQNRIAFYHQNEALLFQFLLHECLRAHQTLRKKPDPDLLIQVIGNFEYSSNTWHAPQGHLPRLVHYCSLLCLHFESPVSHLGNHLRQTLQRACNIAKKCHAIFGTNEKEQSKLYTNLRKEIRTFMKLLFEKLHDFKDNASVLYFLLCHQEQFDALYRAPIIKKIFLSFFPEGTKQAQSFLVEKFVKKGFNHLIPSIEQKLNNL